MSTEEQLTVASLTGGGVEERGVFDKLMRSVKAQLDTELTSGNITPLNYAGVYTGALQYTLATGMDYLLKYRQANMDVLIAEEQILEAKAKVALLNEQIRNITADTAIKAKQLELMTAQISQTQAQVLLTNSQKLKTDKDIEIGTKQLEVMTAQIVQATKQAALVTQQVVNTTNENTTITKQQAKLDVEVEVLTQKKFTEQAQILDTVNGLPVTGVIGKQKILYHQQARGFDRDAEQKLAKILVDTYTVRQTTAGGEDPAANGVDGPQVKQVLTIAKAGITAPIV